MGSFNTSCFASQQIIAPGDPCYIIPVSQEHGFEKTPLLFRGEVQERYSALSEPCYPNALWSPYGAPIEGKYADYGEFTVLDTLSNRVRLLSYICELMSNSAVAGAGVQPVKAAEAPERKTVEDDELGTMVILDLGDDDAERFDLNGFMAEKVPKLYTLLKSGGLNSEVVKGVAFAQIETVWDYLAESMREGLVFASDYSNDVFPIHLAVMHKAAYDNLVAVTAGQKGRDRKLRTQLRAAERILEKVRKSLSTPRPDEEGEARQAMMMAIEIDSLVERELERYGWGGLVNPSEYFEVSLSLAGMDWQGSGVEDVLARLKPVLDTRYAMGALDYLNLRIIPQTYAGQDYVNEIGKAYAKFVAATSASVCAGRPDEDE